jgi:nucleotide-binding universal stress UspA family protein
MSDSLVHIVVGDDFGPPGELAIREALRRGRNAHIHVAHVITGHEPKKLNAAIGAASERLWSRISEVGGHVLGLTAAEISIHVRIGRPVEALEKLAADYDADLIIVGTKDEKGLKSLGSISTALIHEAQCSVLVARTRDHRKVRKTDRPEPARVGEDMHEQRVDTGYSGTQRVSWNPANTGVLMY